MIQYSNTPRREYNSSLASRSRRLLLRPGESVFLRDVATIEDGTDITTGYALVNGRRAVYLLVTKRANASTPLTSRGTWGKAAAHRLTRPRAGQVAATAGALPTRNERRAAVPWLHGHISASDLMQNHFICLRNQWAFYRMLDIVESQQCCL